MVFRDRKSAGEDLATALSKYQAAPNTMVIALPRGGVMLGEALCARLKLPLDIVQPRKIGAPGNSEFAIGAVDEDGEIFLNTEIVNRYNIAENYIHEEAKRQRKEAERRIQLYRSGRSPLHVKGQNILLVDDGIATGFTIRAAAHFLRKKGAQSILLATPVCAADTAAQLEREGWELLALEIPNIFGAVGAFYENFGEVSDEEVMEILKKNYKLYPPPSLS
jgi:putative phosphoribosyl transferase